MLYAKPQGRCSTRSPWVGRAGNDLQLAWRGMGVRWEGQIAALAETALVGIALGAAMPPRIAGELMAELAERRPTLEVWRAKINAARSYRLDFQQVR